MEGIEPMDTTETKDEVITDPNEILCKPGRITLGEPFGDHDGSLKPVLFKGHFKFTGDKKAKKIPVAIKRYQNCEDKELKLVIRNLEILSSENNRHPNLIRYYGEAEYKQFKYLCMELCECSVGFLVTPIIIPDTPYDKREAAELAAKRQHNLRTEILDHLSHKEILRQSAEAVKFLHGLEPSMIHRNLHPGNFLIAKISERDYLVKLTDFHSTKNWKDEPNKSGIRASDGWVAPDGLDKTDDQPDEDARTDVFIMGCFFYFVLSGGKHPFGGNKQDREGNSSKSDYGVYNGAWDGSSSGVNWGVSLPGVKNPFGGPGGNKEGYVKEWEFEMDWWKVEAHNALDLIKNSMIKFSKSERKSMEDVLNHPYFDILTPYKIYDDVKSTSSKNKPGLSVIVSQEKFYKSWTDRPGSEVDAVKLKETFAGFGYDVLLYKNLTAQQMRDWITPGKLNDLCQYNSLVVCILSHGDKGNVYGVDDEPVIINELKYAFNGGDCEALDGKPKIFVIQACQGNNKQLVQGSKSAPDTATLRCRMPISDEKPPLIDHLSLMATIEEFVSLRHAKSGSYFIQAFCQQLQSEYGHQQVSASHSQGVKSRKTRDLLQLFHSEVVPRVARGKIQIKGETIKQTAESRSSLLRTIRFRQQGEIKEDAFVKGYDGARDNAAEFQECRDKATEELEKQIGQTRDEKRKAVLEEWMKKAKAAERVY